MISLKQIVGIWGLLCALAAPALAHNPTLDEANLRSSVASRINMMLSGQPDGSSRFIAPDDVRIDKTQPVSVQGITLYAVRILLAPHAAADSTASEPDEMVLLTDPSGSVQIGMVTDLKTGREIAMAQASELTRMDISSQLTHPILTGEGDKEVVFVSDPYCPYCRQAYSFLRNQLAHIRTLALVHLPLPMHPGADAAVWVMLYAQEQAKILHEDVVDFAYTALAVPEAAGASTEAAQKQVIGQFLARFPELSAQEPDSFYYFLKGKYEAENLTTAKALQKLRITGTPVVIIDGQPVHGFDQQAITTRLAQ